MKRIKTLATALVATFILSACTDSDGARQTLEAHGFTKVTTHGYSFFGCGQDDTFATAFTAESPTGGHVSGVVCSGILKGSTVRLN